MPTKKRTIKRYFLELYSTCSSIFGLPVLNSEGDLSLLGQEKCCDKKVDVAPGIGELLWVPLWLLDLDLDLERKRGET